MNVDACFVRVGIIHWNLNGATIKGAVIIALIPFNLLIIETGQSIWHSLVLTFEMWISVVDTATGSQRQKSSRTEGSQRSKSLCQCVSFAYLEGSVSSGPRNKC